jgi:hypothetical protein
MAEMTLTHFVDIEALVSLAKEPIFLAKYGKTHMDQFAKQHTCTELFNAITGTLSLWGNSTLASWEDFWEYSPFTLKREEGRAQDLGYNVTGTMLTVILRSYKLKHPETYKAFQEDFYRQLKDAHPEATRARVSTNPSQMFGPAMRASAPIWFLTKTIPIMPKPQSGFRGFIYLKKEHACLFAEDPGHALFSKACAALHSCTKEDEQTLQVRSLYTIKYGCDSVILDGFDSFKCKVPRYPVHGVGNNGADAE